MRKVSLGKKAKKEQKEGKIIENTSFLDHQTLTTHTPRPVRDTSPA